MRWIEEEISEGLPAAATAGLLRQALEKHPEDPDLHLTFGSICYQMQDYRAAVCSLEAAAGARPAAFSRWPMLADAYLALKLPTEALDACARAAAAGVGNALICCRRGTALRKLGRVEEARSEFERCVALGDDQLRGLRELLRPLARQADGGPLLAYCDALPAKLQATALVRANRAIALSRLGRTDEAGELIDLDRHISRIPIPPPPAADDGGDFNARLASELQKVARKAGRIRDVEIFYNIGPKQSPALAALVPLLRGAFEAYLGQWQERGLDRAFSARPEAAKMPVGFTILRGDASNGEHIHSEAYLSAVYHVAVPREIATAENDRGALIVGGCEQYTGGYQGCWGKRSIRPEEGWLTLFPSHIFHDVVPSRTRAPRIAVAADMRVAT